MKTLRLLIIVSCTVLATPIFGQEVLIDFGSSWQYYDHGDEPTDTSGMDWNDINFDASAWSQGTAQLGYGEGDENTSLDVNANTVYFRYNFNVVNPIVFEGIKFDLIYDDGAVVYLNGTEIWRVNMPSGPIDYNSFAFSASAPNDTADNVFASSLVTGDNVLSVEIHQVNDASTNLSFDLEFTGLIHYMR